MGCDAWVARLARRRSECLLQAWVLPVMHRPMMPRGVTFGLKHWERRLAGVA